MIISLDPGKTCGMIAIRDNGDVAQRMEAPAFSTLDCFASLVHDVRPLQVVVERYTMNAGKMTHQPDALEVIGAARFLCMSAGVQFTLQSRGDRMRCSFATLRKLELWTTSPGGHINEAARHAVVYVVKHVPEHPIAKRVFGMIESGSAGAEWRNPMSGENY